MGKATTYHGRQGAGTENQYTAQLWWEYAQDGDEAGPVRVPRITIVLRDKHAAHTRQVDGSHRTLRTKPESIYANEVIVGTGAAPE
jgi:hypothetical protein